MFDNSEFFKDDLKQFQELVKKYTLRYIERKLDENKISIQANSKNYAVSIHKKPNVAFSEKEQAVFLEVKNDLYELWKGFRFFSNQKQVNSYLKKELLESNDFDTTINDKYFDFRDVVEKILLFEFLKTSDLTEFAYIRYETYLMCKFLDEKLIPQFLQTVNHILTRSSISQSLSNANINGDFILKKLSFLQRGRSSIDTLKAFTIEYPDETTQLVENVEYDQLLNLAQNMPGETQYEIVAADDLAVDINKKSDQSYRLDCKIKNSQNYPGSYGNAHFRTVVEFNAMQNLSLEQLSELEGAFKDVLLTQFGIMRSIMSCLKHHQMIDGLYHIHEVIQKPKFESYYSKFQDNIQNPLLKKVDGFINSNTTEACSRDLNDEIKTLLDVADQQIKQPFYQAIKNKNHEKVKFYAHAILQYKRFVKLYLKYNIKYTYETAFSSGYGIKNLINNYKNKHAPYLRGVSQGLISYSRLKKLSFGTMDEFLVPDKKYFNLTLESRRRKDYISNDGKYYRFNIGLDTSKNKFFIPLEIDGFCLNVSSIYNQSMGLEKAKEHALADLKAMKHILDITCQDINQKYSVAFKDYQKIKTIYSEITRDYMSFKNRK